MAEQAIKPQASRGAQTVTVACKMPNGLILRVFKLVDRQETLSGGRTQVIQLAMPVEVNGLERVVVKGNALPYGQIPRGYEVVNDGVLTDGYALTPGVDKDFWDAWLEQNKESDVVRNGMICAYEKPTEAEAYARDNMKRRSGLEPIVPDTDKRIPRPTSANVTPIKTEQRAVN